jgi:hypothetical protein
MQLMFTPDRDRWIDPVTRSARRRVPPLAFSSSVRGHAIGTYPSEKVTCLERAKQTWSGFPAVEGVCNVLAAGSRWVISCLPLERLA